MKGDIFFSKHLYTAFQSLPKGAEFVWEYLKDFTKEETIDSADIAYSDPNIATGIMPAQFKISPEAYKLYQYNRDNSAVDVSLRLSSILSIQLIKLDKNDRVWDEVAKRKSDINQELFELLFYPQIGEEEYKAGVKKVKISQKMTDLMIEDCTIDIYLQHFSLLNRASFIAFLQLGRPIELKFGYVQNPQTVDKDNIFDLKSEYVVKKKMIVTNYTINVDSDDGTVELSIKCVVSPVSTMSNSKFWNYLNFNDDYLTLVDDFVTGLNLTDSNSFLSKSPRTTEFLLAMNMLRFLSISGEKIVVNADNTFIKDLFDNAMGVYKSVSDKENELNKSIDALKDMQISDACSFNLKLGDIFPGVTDMLTKEETKIYIYHEFPQYFFIFYPPDFETDDEWTNKEFTKQWSKDAGAQQKGQDNPMLKVAYSKPTMESIQTLATLNYKEYKKNPRIPWSKSNGAPYGVGDSPQDLFVPYENCKAPVIYDAKRGKNVIDSDKIKTRFFDDSYIYFYMYTKLFVEVLNAPAESGGSIPRPIKTAFSILQGIDNMMSGNQIVSIFRMLAKAESGFTNNISSKMSFSINADSIKSVQQDKIDNNQALLNNLMGDRNVTPAKIKEWVDNWLSMSPMNVLDSAIRKVIETISNKKYYYFTDSKLKDGVNYQYLHIISEEQNNTMLNNLECSATAIMDLANKAEILTINIANDQNLFGGIEFSFEVNTNMPYAIADSIDVYGKNVKFNFVSYLYNKYKGTGGNISTQEEINKEELKTDLFNMFKEDKLVVEYFGNKESNIMGWLNEIFSSPLIVDKLISEIRTLQVSEKESPQSASVQNSDQSIVNSEEDEINALLEKSGGTRQYLDSLGQTMIKWVADTYIRKAKLTILGIPDIRLSSYLLIIDNRNQKEKAKNVASAIYIINTVEHILENGVYKTVIEAESLRNIIYNS